MLSLSLYQVYSQLDFPLALMSAPHPFHCSDRATVIPEELIPAGSWTISTSPRVNWCQAWGEGWTSGLGLWTWRCFEYETQHSGPPRQRDNNCTASSFSVTQPPPFPGVQMSSKMKIQRQIAHELGTITFLRRDLDSQFLCGLQAEGETELGKQLMSRNELMKGDHKVCNPRRFYLSLQLPWKLGSDMMLLGFVSCE